MSRNAGFALALFALVGCHKTGEAASRNQAEQQRLLVATPVTTDSAPEIAPELEAAPPADAVAEVPAPPPVEPECVAVEESMRDVCPADSTGVRAVSNVPLGVSIRLLNTVGSAATMTDRLACYRARGAARAGVAAAAPTEHAVAAAPTEQAAGTEQPTVDATAVAAAPADSSAPAAPAGTPCLVDLPNVEVSVAEERDGTAALRVTSTDAARVRELREKARALAPRRTPANARAAASTRASVN